MARMQPEMSEEQLAELPSQAEADFYRACRDQLPEQCLVLHSLSWVWPDTNGTPRDGEADFVIFDRSRGILVVEVKGGGIRVDPGTDTWISIGGRQTYRIKNPFKQVLSEKYAVLGQLKAHAAWQSIGCPRVLLGHGVFLPDVDDVLPLASPQRPREIIGGRRDLREVSRWISSVFRYWTGSDGRCVTLSDAGMQAIEQIFCTPLEVRPLVCVQLRHEEERRIRLTSQQAKVLRSLGTRTRAAMCGGAGTGKTILAYQKANEAAASGLQTLLLCYNRPLADHLQEMVGTKSNLRAMDFHQLCDWRARTVKARRGRDVIEEARRSQRGGDYFHDVLPLALCLTLEELDDQYDAIIVDEAQDFRDSYWVPIELLLRDTAKSLLYVFFDQNQAVYQQRPTFPVSELPFVLSVNCRNTRHIHEVSYRFSKAMRPRPARSTASQWRWYVRMDFRSRPGRLLATSPICSPCTVYRRPRSPS